MLGELIFTLIIVILVVLSVGYIFKDSLKNIYIGLRKNARIRKKIKRLVNENDYLYLHDLCLRLDAGKYINVDHVVIADKYIYIIESKFWLGYVFGNDEDEKWLLNDGKGTIYVDNPLKTARFKSKIMANVLNISADNFVNIVCIADCGKIKEVNIKDNAYKVLGEKETLTYILEKEKHARINVYKSEEVEKIALKLYDYHKASLEDKAYYQKHKNKY
ncbi:MAG: NERD domain-containing protein [Bacilli bacterium]|nr:NERD domain-containing protein [Bacilli bacterium]